MAKTKQDKADERVESAIRALWTKFEQPSRHGCSRAKSRETAAIQKKINKRKEELDKDAKLKDLEIELKESKKKAHISAQKLHDRVDDLMRRFQLRGVTDALLSDIEKLAAEEPILIGDECE